MNTKTLSRTISVCVENGKKLLEDAKYLFGWDRYSTALALSVLAQEEFAKAFLLQLVMEEALPWLPEVRRSMAKHQCKHLLAIVMEWLPPFDFDLLAEQQRRSTEKHEKKMAWYKRSMDRYRAGNLRPDPNDPDPIEEEFHLPADVATALNIYRFEELEKLKSGYAWRDADWAKGKARKVADGALDRKKQSALYVDVTETGEVGLHPGLITRAEAHEAIQRAERLSYPLISYSDEYRKLKEILPLVFSSLKEVEGKT
jgi:AbiV family abortive infection protein